MSCLEDTIDDVEVPGGKPADHIGHKALPLLGEILLSDNSNRLAELLLHGAGGLEHQVNDESLHGVPVRPVNFVNTLIRDGPVSLHVILESDRSCHLKMYLLTHLA